jgi:anti-sigma B factor antagonist
MTRHEEHVLTRVADARAEEVIVVAGAPDDLQRPAALRLSHRILPTGEAIADIGGELDIATADVAVRYVRLVIDRHGGPLIVDLAGLAFCDAQGLSALLRIATYAERTGSPFRLASPRPLLVKIMQITGLDRRFLLRPSGLQSPPYDHW